MREVLRLREHLPHHVEQWLTFISYRGIGNEYLVRYNVMLMEPRHAFAVIMSFRRLFEKVMQNELPVYHRIMLLMAHFDGWPSSIAHFDNQLMALARAYTENSKMQSILAAGGGSSSSRGLSTLASVASSR